MEPQAAGFRRAPLAVPLGSFTADGAFSHRRSIGQSRPRARVRGHIAAVLKTRRCVCPGNRGGGPWQSARGVPGSWEFQPGIGVRPRP